MNNSKGALPALLFLLIALVFCASECPLLLAVPAAGMMAVNNSIGTPIAILIVPIISIGLGCYNASLLWETKRAKAICWVVICSIVAVGWLILFAG